MRPIMSLTYNNLIIWGFLICRRTGKLIILSRNQSSEICRKRLASVDSGLGAVQKEFAVVYTDVTKATILASTDERNRQIIVKILSAL